MYGLHSGAYNFKTLVGERNIFLIVTCERVFVGSTWIIWLGTFVFIFSGTFHCSISIDRHGFRRLNFDSACCSFCVGLILHRGLSQSLRLEVGNFISSLRSGIDCSSSRLMLCSPRGLLVFSIGCLALREGSNYMLVLFRFEIY